MEIAVKLMTSGSYTSLSLASCSPLRPKPCLRLVLEGAPWTYTPLPRPQPLDLSNGGANPYTRGFLGGFTDGRYGYLVPGFIG